jgi:prepilin-type N-terminal cleavage/methylation domain-containing protein
MRSRAFTLLELLVVIAVLAILIAASVPVVRALTKGNHQAQAVNLLTTMLAHARATAVMTHRPTGLLVYEYPNPNFTASTSYAQLVTQRETNGSLRLFAHLPGATPQRLPAGIQVAMLGDAGFYKGTDVQSTSSRIIVFDSSGQMVLVNGIGLHFSEMGDLVTDAWNLRASDDNNLYLGVSSPGFVVYDGDAYIEALSSPVAVDPNKWLQQHATIVIVNPYTGNVMR